MNRNPNFFEFIHVADPLYPVLKDLLSRFKVGETGATVAFSKGQESEDTDAAAAPGGSR